MSHAADFLGGQQHPGAQQPGPGAGAAAHARRQRRDHRLGRRGAFGSTSACQPASAIRTSRMRGGRPPAQGSGRCVSGCHVKVHHRICQACTRLKCGPTLPCSSFQLSDASTLPRCNTGIFAASGCSAQCYFCERHVRLRPSMRCESLQITYADLRFQKQIGEGSFGRVYSGQVAGDDGGGEAAAPAGGGSSGR